MAEDVVVVPIKENWSWSKFFKGFFDGRNYAKAIVLGTCLAIIIAIGYCVYTVAKARFAPKQPTIQTVSGGTVDSSVNKKVKNSIIGIF